MDEAARALLAEQRPDGGWGQTPTLETDAYATGQALVALQWSGRLAASDPALQRGIAFLLRTQLSDGSWLVRSRTFPFQPYKESGFPHGKDQWISASGSSWAAMALSLTGSGSRQEVSGL
jgi:squalene cyclase